MTPTEFCYWLRGYFEISGASGIHKEGALGSNVTVDQGLISAKVIMIKEHLDMVFNQEPVLPVNEAQPFLPYGFQSFPSAEDYNEFQKKCRDSAYIDPDASIVSFPEPPRSC